MMDQQLDTRHSRAYGTFAIVLAWSDITLTVGPEQTAMQVLLDAGVPIEPGCGTGGCGLCKTAYVERNVVHKDACLSQADRAHHFCPCVSRAETRVVLPL